MKKVNKDFIFYRKKKATIFFNTKKQILFTTLSSISKITISIVVALFISFIPTMFNWNTVNFYLLIILTLGAFLFVFLICNLSDTVHMETGQLVVVFCGHYEFILGKTIACSSFNDTFIVLNIAVMIAMLIISIILSFIKIGNKSIFLYIWNNKQNYLSFIWENKIDIFILLLCIWLVIIVVNCMLYMVGLSIVVSTTSTKMFLYSFLAKVTSIKVVLTIIISSITKELRVEQLSLSIPTVLAIILLGGFNYFIFIPNIQIFAFSILADLDITYTKICLYINDMKVSSCKFLTEKWDNLYNKSILILKNLKAYNHLYYHTSSNRASIFRSNNSNFITKNEKVIHMTKINKFTSINIATIVPKNLNVSINYKSTTNNLTWIFISYVDHISNFVNIYSNINCNINLICPGQNITIHSVFEKGYLKEYSLERVPLKNNYSFNNFYYNGKDKVNELLALTDPTRTGSDLKVFMQQGSNITSYNIPEREGSTITGEPSGSTKGKKRALGNIDDSTLAKRKKTAINSTTSDSVNLRGIEENSTANFKPLSSIITESDVIENAFYYDSIYSKISKSIELEQVGKRDPISMLNFENKEVKSHFYKSIKALNLTNYKDVSRTKIINLLQGLEKFVDINPKNPNSINISDFDGDELNIYVVHTKISGIIKNANENIVARDHISKLTFEPESIKYKFYDSIESLGLADKKKNFPLQIGTLLKLLEDRINLEIYDNHIIEEDFLKEFKFNVIYKKIISLIESDQVNRNQYVSHLKFQPQGLKTEFYDRLTLLGLAQKYVPSTTINQLINKLENFIDIEYTKDYSIKIQDFSEDGLKCKNIHDKILRFIELEEYVNIHTPLSKLVFEPESLRKIFYSQLKAFEGINSLPKTLGILLNTLLEEMDKDNPNRINSDDFKPGNFNYKLIHSKISNLIKLGEVVAKNNISGLKFKPKDLRQDFYDSVQILRLTDTKDVRLTTIKSLLKHIEKYIDIIPNNPNSIIISDFLEQGLDYKSVYGKISSLIKDSSNNIGPRDTLKKLTFEPESLRFEFYNQIRDLKLTNYKAIHSTKLTNFTSTLEKIIAEKSIDAISTNDSIIRRSDLLDEGLDYKSIYSKISNLIKANIIGPEDRLSKLKFEPESLRSEFYIKIKDLNLTNYNEVGKTHINNFKNKLQSEIAKIDL